MKNNIKIVRRIDDSTGCEYIFTTIKKKIDENKSFMPRIKLTNEVFSLSTSLIDYVKGKNIPYAINAGIFNTKTLEPECVLIIDNKIIYDRKETYIHVNPNDGDEKRDVLYTLGINKSGDFKMYKPCFSAKEILNDGCQDAVMGFVPLIIDYEEFKDGDDIVPYGSRIDKPRQIVGQLKNGDYYILTAKAPGLTFQTSRDLLKKLDVPFAYDLDGGSSTETTFFDERLTPVYRDVTGRKIPTIMTFEPIEIA